MPKLIFADGKEAVVDYETGLKIYHVLNQLAEPEDDKQADFVSRVSDVVFERAPRRSTASRELTDEDRAERREKLASVRSDKSLKGYEKFKAIGRVLKNG